MTKSLEIIIPTFNNPEFLNPCVMSIIKTGILDSIGTLTIVNNGSQPIEKVFGDVPNIKILKPETNLGWERGLDLALKESTAQYVCFQNDDTHIPQSNKDLYRQLIEPLLNENVGACGPITTTAAGAQSIFHPMTPTTLMSVPWLIFFCVMLRREDVEQLGGIDIDAPGGDDFDLSIRLRQAGKHLVINPKAFIIHHGFKTGTRVRGNHDKPGGWNSVEMQERTNKYLIQKHGFKTFIETLHGITVEPEKEKASV